MNDKEEFFLTGNAPGGRGAARRKQGGRGCFRAGVVVVLSAVALLVAAVVVIDATDSGARVKRKIASWLGVSPAPPAAPPAPAEAEPLVVEKVVEVPVETVVEKVVEKVVEVEVLPPMPSSFVPYRRVDVATLWNEIPVSTSVVASEGENAALERERDEAYEIEMRVNVTVPRPNRTLEELASINEHLPKMLKDLERLVEGAEVSPFFHHLYEIKLRRLQENVTRLNAIPSRHNFFDLETVLQMSHPETGQKVLFVQSEMDVVTDGSDGDRWPELDDYISMSQFYQPFTSYGWAKRSSTPNPLLSRWEDQLKEYEDEFAIPGLTIERNRYLRAQIEKLTAEIADMKARSYLIAEADPFFVIPLSFLGRRDENEFGPAIGDFGVIVYEDKLYPAIAGDAGPTWKFGEASLFVARELSERASPYNRPVSDLEVTYLIFPGSADERRGPPDLERWHARCEELLEGIGGLAEGYELHRWEDLIAKKKAESEEADAADPQAAEPEPQAPEPDPEADDPDAAEDPGEAAEEAADG